MKFPAITIALVLVLSSCDSEPVVAKPSKDQVIGVWKCSKFPATVLREASVASDPITSVIDIRDDGTCSAQNFPQRTPYRLIDVEQSSWEFADPSMTPSGSWSIEFDGHFLQCRQEDGSLVLRYLISGKDKYHIDYKKAQQGVGERPDTARKVPGDLCASM